MNDRFEKNINRLNSYLRLTRFKYGDMERLSRLQILQDYYKTQMEQADNESIRINIESAESLSANLVLPLKVRGVFLTEGRPKIKYYSAEELKKAVENPINKNFPLMLDHKDKEASMVVGVVERLEYDPAIKGIRWFGHINDETFARNVLDGVIRQVSATIFSSTEQTSVHGIVGKDLVFKELSLVMDGAEKFNSIEPY